jgi:PTS system ascorbate-specific IIB component
MINIMTVCGMGLGSSLLASMTAERALKAAGIDPREFRIETSDMGSARRSDIDIYLTTNEFAPQIEQWGTPVVVIKNVFDEAEVGAALVPTFRRVAEEK